MIRRSLAALAVMTVAACATLGGEPKSVVDAAAADPSFKTLSKLISEAGLTDTLRGPGPFTVFAPTDDAFSKLPAKTMAELTADKNRLRAVLNYHVVPAKVTAAEVKTGNLKTVQGANLALGRAGSFVTVEAGVVTRADLVAGNGVVHAIDTVLLPPSR